MGNREVYEAHYGAGSLDSQAARTRLSNDATTRPEKSPTRVDLAQSGSDKFAGSDKGAAKPVDKAALKPGEKQADKAVAKPGEKTHTAGDTKKLPGKPDKGAVDKPGEYTDKTKEDPAKAKLREELSKKLADKNVSAEDKIRAVHHASKNGVTSVQIADKDGKMRNYDLQTSKIDNNREYVHLWSKDDQGKTHIVLRAIYHNNDGKVEKAPPEKPPERPDTSAKADKSAKTAKADKPEKTDNHKDRVERERDPKGHYVTHEGTWWQKHMADKSGIPMPEQKKEPEKPKPPSQPDLNGKDSKPVDKAKEKPKDAPVIKDDKKVRVDVAPKPTGVADDRNRVVVRGGADTTKPGTDLTFSPGTTKDRVTTGGDRVNNAGDRVQPTNDNTRPQVYVKPGESIQKAVDNAPENAVINVEEGVYNERLNITRDNIKLKAKGKAVLDMRGRAVEDGVINISGRKNVTVEGFEIRNAKGGETPTAIRVDGASSDINIVNNDIHHIESSSNAHGIAVYGDGTTPMKNINIANNRVHDLKLGRSEAIVLNGNIDGFKVVDNIVRDNDNIGIDIIGYEGNGPRGVDRPRNGLIARNTLANIDSSKNPAYGRASAGAIYVDGGSDIEISENRVSSSNYGIELASEHSGKFSERIKVRNNRINGSQIAAISLGGGEARNGGARSILLENNQGTGNADKILYQHNVDRSTVVEQNNRL